MNTQTQELVRDLGYVRSILRAMNNLNQEEIQTRNNLMKPKAIPAIPARTTKTIFLKKHWEGFLLAGMAVLFILFVLLHMPTGIKTEIENSRAVYNNAVFNDKFNWEIKWRDKGGEIPEYPGYQGPVRLYTTAEAIWHALPSIMIVSAIYTIVIGLVAFIILKIKERDKKTEEEIRLQRYQASIQQNRAIQDNNNRVQARIDVIHKKKQLFSNEYITSVSSRFPNNFNLYCYPDAIDFFIRELELGTALTLQDAILLYREHVYREHVTNALDQMNDRLRIIIDNQQIMIRKQDELIRQQIIGNAIACATFAETRGMADNVERIRRSSAETAYQTSGRWDSNW